MIRPSLYEVALWLVAEMFGGSNCCSLCGKRNRALTKEIAEHLRMGKTGRQEARPQDCAVLLARNGLDHAEQFLDTDLP